MVRPLFRVHHADAREPFEDALRGATVGVVIVADDDENVEAWYRELSRKHPTVSFVLVARLAPTPARAIVRAGPDDVFWWPGHQDTLLGYLGALSAPDPTRVLAHVLALERTETFELATITMLRCLADLDEWPITSVRGLARRSRISESAFRSQIRKDFRNCTAKQLIDRLVWLRAAAAVVRFASRERPRLRVARAIGIDAGTLDDVAVRMTGRSFLSSASEVRLQESLARFGAFWREARTG